MKHQTDPLKTRNISLAEKRQLMWNIIQPGDPYDIRKSMIAQLPGQRKFMGPHLEIVCLLQAAQIERLCSFLDEYALKLREQERVVLDRHSYQIQIKQLSEKIAIDERFKMQNQKLRDFIRMQSKQLEDLQRQRFNIQINKKYEDSLRQLELVMKQNDEIKTSLQRVISDNTNRNEQFRMTELNYQQEIQRLNERINNEKSLLDSVDREKTLSLQQLLQKQKRYQQQLTILRQKNISLTIVIQKSEAANRLLKEDVSKLAIQEKKNQQYYLTIQQYQHRFQLLASQIERVNGILRQKSKELQEQYIRVKQLSDEKRIVEEQGNEQQSKIKNLLTTIANLQKQNKQMWLVKSSYQEREQVIHNYQSRIQKLSFEVDRLNSVLRKKINELDESRKKNRQYEISLGNFEIIQKQVNDLRLKLVDVNKKLFEFEKLHTTQAQQIERLNFTLKRMIDQINYSQVKLKNSEKELENQMKRNSGLQKDLSEQIRINQQNKRVKQVFEQNLNQIKHQTEEAKVKYKNYQSLNQQNEYLRRELNKHISNIQELRGLSESQNNKINQFKNQIELATKVKNQAQLYIESLQANISTYQLNNKKLREQNSQLVKALQQKNRVPSPQKQKILQQTQSVIIAKPDNKFLQLRQEVLQKQQRIHQLQKEVSIRQTHIKELSGNLNWLQKQCRQLEQRLRSSSKESQFLFNQNNNLKANFSILQENYCKVLLELQEKKKQSSSSGVQRKEISTPQRLPGDKPFGQKNMSSGIQSSSTYIKQIKREHQMLQTEYTAIKQERINFIQSLKQLRVENNSLVEQNKRLKKIVDEQGQYYKKVIIFSEQIERLNGVLKEKEKQNKSTVYKLVQYEQTIQSLEQKINKITSQLSPMKQEPRKDQSNYLQYDIQISRMKGQIEISRTKLNEQEHQLALYQSKIAILGEEIERLNGILKGKVNQNIELQKAYTNVFSQKQDILLRFKEVLNQNQALGAYEQKLNLMNLEIVRLNKILQEKIQINDNLNVQYTKYKQDQVIKINSLNQQLRQYEVSIINLKMEIQQNKINSQSSPTSQEYQQKIVELSHQLQRLNNIILSNTNQMENISKKSENYLQEIQRLNNSLRIKVEECVMRDISQKNYLSDIENLRNQIIKQTKQKELIIQNRDVFSQQIVKAKQQMFIYQTKIKDLYQQFQRLQVVMKTLKKENEENKNNQSDLSELIQKNRNLGAEIDRLWKLLDEKTQQVSQIRLSLSQDSSLQRRMSEDLTIMVVLFAEIESLRARVEVAESQNQQIRRTSFKKNFEQLQGSSWYYESKGDEKIYESSVEHINEQMRIEKRQVLKKTIEKLGFREQKDYDGKIVLKNNIPIKKSMTYREVQNLINRLKEKKTNQNASQDFSDDYWYQKGEFKSKMKKRKS